MAGYLDFLRALDEYTRANDIGCISSGSDMHIIAARARLLIQPADQSAARWTGQLVDLKYLDWTLKSAGDRRPIPVGGWTPDDLHRFSDYYLTHQGREEADRMRRLERDDITDAAMSQRMPDLLRPWMTPEQRRAITEPLRGLRSALDEAHDAAAIGSARDLVEAACKIALAHAGQPLTGKPSLPTLFKDAHRAVAADRDEPSGDLGRSLAAAVDKLGVLRNKIGAGHGHAAAPMHARHHARLAASAATGVAAFILGER